MIELKFCVETYATVALAGAVPDTENLVNALVELAEVVPNEVDKNVPPLYQAM